MLRRRLAQAARRCYFPEKPSWSLAATYTEDARNAQARTTVEEVERVCDLAHLAPPPPEKVGALVSDLDATLRKCEKLKAHAGAVGLKDEVLYGVPRGASAGEDAALGCGPGLREDAVTEAADVLAQAPEAEDGHYRVPRVM
mmetsp:Transcript_19991/g.60534  ORF Transcript_19991/g.60534 Transcript_19991/m.60534 type:complete len:142 (-) Transcript_19991:83-508(-)